jgi:hypothetical protein
VNPTRVLMLVGLAVVAGCGPTGASPTPTTSTTVPVAPAPIVPDAPIVAHVPDDGYAGGGDVFSFCDNGNRVYIYDARQRAGIAVLSDPTCPGGKP